MELTISTNHLQFTSNPCGTDLQNSYEQVTMNLSETLPDLHEAAKEGDLRAYCDADWAGDSITRKSTTGFCVFIGDSLISWKSKKQDVLSKSSTEAEYCAMSVTTSEIVWLRWLLADMSVHITSPTLLYCDNHSAIQIAHNTVFHERTKHIEIDCHFTRHHLQAGTISLSFVPSSLQIADILTKPHYDMCFRFFLTNSQCSLLQHCEFKGRY
ncbi:uncharacterized mitochondrial protein-like protein [Tanacetum coccineum]